MKYGSEALERYQSNQIEVKTEWAASPEIEHPRVCFAVGEVGDGDQAAGGPRPRRAQSSVRWLRRPRTRRPAPETSATDAAGNPPAAIPCESGPATASPFAQVLRKSSFDPPPRLARGGVGEPDASAIERLERRAAIDAHRQLTQAALCRTIVVNHRCHPGRRSAVRNVAARLPAPSP